MSFDECDESAKSENIDPSKYGELRLRLFYTADHVLPLELYKPLQMNLINSLGTQPFCTTTAGLLEYLPSVSSNLFEDEEIRYECSCYNWFRM
ncbi:unnamed protein product [Anisakis simplex]|uniref:FERM domain-containing protein n=1 Tax=Anisakis simplex TaxID=6269 RepID=A0A0M3JBF5_ANISI|nr:unnamed protein product [Anisakis simplex]